jgi:hypothetical protein
VYPHIRDLTNLTEYPSLKPNIIFCVYLLDHNLSLIMDHQFKEDSKTMPLLKISSISPKEMYFWYLPYLYHLFARGRATFKHGGEVGTMQFWSSRGANKKLMRKKNKKMRKIKKEQKYEYEKKRRKEKNMSMYDIKIK